MLQGRGRVRIDHADHFVIDARPGGATVVKDRVAVVDQERPRRRVCEYGVHGLESRKESHLVHSRVFVGDTWVSILGANHRVVGRVELKQYGIAGFCEHDVGNEGIASLFFLNVSI